MNLLKKNLVKDIRTTGPISVADYMARCLFHPVHGYYNKKQPFGADGDFITAPDISQMFGELTALWLVQVWEAIGSPKQFTLCEIGPGRGTWMRDIIRAANRTRPEFINAAHIVLIEKSSRLTEVQKTALQTQHHGIDWVDNLDTLSEQPTIIIANELFDALPTRQFVKTESGWLERLIDLGSDGDLIFVPGSATIDEAILPPQAFGAEIGSIFEYAPAREALAQQIADYIVKNGGTGLFIDYGHAKSDLGDTLQAVRNHTYEDIFAEPGDADLTSHVDFESLNIAAKRSGAQTYGIVTQAEFLLAHGLLERAGALGASKNTVTQKSISETVHRLAGNADGQMGDLFKVMCLTASGLDAPAPFSKPG